MGLAALALLTSAVFIVEPGDREVGMPTKVVVESLPLGSALARAGVEPGDVLETWTTMVGNATSLLIDSPFTFEDLRIEQAPRGRTRLHGKRGSEPVSFVVEPGDWRAEVRPAMSPVELQAYDAMRREVEDGRFEEALARVRRVVHGTGGWQRVCWWWLRTGKLLVDARAFDAAHTAYGHAEEVAQAPIARAAVAHAAGQLGRAENDLAAAEKAHREILAHGEDTKPSLVVARSHAHLAEIAWERGETDKVGEHYRQALAITEEVAPHSYTHAKCLNDIAFHDYTQGEAEAAEAALKEGQRLFEELAPRSNEYGTNLYYRGILKHQHGQFTEAIRYFERALKIAEDLAVTDQDLKVASLLSAMGRLLLQTGDLALAEEHLRRARGIEEQQIPDSSQFTSTLMALAVAFEGSGRLASALETNQRALAIAQELDNEYFISNIQANLANLAMKTGQHEGAAKHFQRMLETERRLARGSTGIPWALLNLGRLAEEQKDFTAAAAYYHEAVAFLEREAPRHPYLQLVLTHLGDLARRRSHLDDAERFYRRALGIYGAAEFSEAQVRHGLGLTLGQRGELHVAAAELQGAVTTLEDQLRHLGGSRHAQGDFRARFREIYDDALAAELTRGRPEQAFHLLERSRARSLLEMLTERDLDFTLDLSEELATAHRGLERRSREAMDEIRTSGDEAAFEEKLGELERLRKEQENFEALLSRTSPRFAALRYPTPHDITEVRSNLDPGTVLLAFNVAEERTDLFVVTPEAGLVDVVNLQIGSQKLRRNVAGYLDLLTKRREPNSPSFLALTEQGRDLYDLLIAPVEQAIKGGTRLLIVPDGPLHQLPFAALVRPMGDYMVEWRPLHTVLSATLYAQLQKEQPAAARPAAIRLAAFGDPHYPSWLRQEPETISEPWVRSAVRSGLSDWEPLPHSRREIEDIAKFFSEKDVQLHLGTEATEEAVRSLDAEVDLVHFAVHGHLDDRFPLNSALVLAMPETPDGTRHDGLLHAWEIFDSVRLGADLVVLSACSTALGQERGGEGFVGLVHAFHYAGARSVLASLWNVNDKVTPELMIGFHRHLRSGLAKDEALRAAQLDQLKNTDTAAPYHWAAFHLLGHR